jgi:putative sterol carrier protein
MENAREIFEKEASLGFDPRLRGIRGTFRFDVTKVGSWFVTIDDGQVEVHEDPSASADCIIEGPESDLVAILNGELRAVIAFMQGRIRFRGDMGLFNRFHGWAGTKQRDLPMEGQRP